MALAAAPAPAAHPAVVGRYLLAAAVGAVGVSGLAAGVVAGLSGLIAYSAARARGVWGEGDPPEGAAHEVEFLSAEDHTRICGWFFRAPSADPAPAVVLCHGAWTGRRECLPLALRFREAGYNVLAFDFRAHGQSDGRYISVGHHETKDVLGAVAFLKDQSEVDPSRIAVVGFSMGGAASLRAAARSQDIRAVVADSAYADFRDAVAYSFQRVGHLPSYPFASVTLQWARWLVKVDPRDLRPIDAVGSISPHPLLLIHGEADEIVPLRHAYELFAAAEEPKHLWVVPNAHHVGARDVLPDTYFARVEGFLREALDAPVPVAGSDTSPAPRITPLLQAA